MFGGIVSDLRNVAVRLVLLFAVSVVPGFSHAQDSLRTRLDSARNRLWVLGLDDVRVYDAATKQLLQRIVLQRNSVDEGAPQDDATANKPRRAIRQALQLGNERNDVLKVGIRAGRKRVELCSDVFEALAEGVTG